MTDLTQGAAWMNGEITPISEAKIGVTDWGLTRSDITYDVVHVWDGSFFRLADYLDRFMVSIRKMRLEIPQSRDEISGILHDMVAASGLHCAYVSMVACRGTPIVPGSRDPRACHNHFYAWVVPFVWVIPPDVAKRGAHVLLAGTTTRISPHSVDPTVKNYHWADMTSALFEALDAGYDTTVLLDDRGCITEGPGFNIFALIDGAVVTPKSGMLEGITRRTVLEICAELGLATEVRDIPAKEFLDAKEVFTATTAGGPVAVTRVNVRTLGNGTPGKVSQQIIQTYWDWHQRPELTDMIDYPDGARSR
ncbi:MAG: branched-chain amino acid--2-keto-4-methylthiobutyrate aminotransferase [Rhodobacteraceae bacterium]|nr:branched-chain amino acid--2-keto-4-methylthiobutyrate aminotransferase [Paracoccaceae bacterium]